MIFVKRLIYMIFLPHRERPWPTGGPPHGLDDCPDAAFFTEFSTGGAGARQRRGCRAPRAARLGGRTAGALVCRHSKT
ncbi:hypothetical protein AAHH78_34935, partial [Burkholderia pseudomallei]